MKRTLLRWILPVILPLLLLGGIRIFSLPEGNENSTDVYWHIYAAERPLAEMTAKTYPVTMSVWRDHFADKELLFHVLLKSYTSVKTAFGAPPEPPFHGASVLIMTLFFAAYVLALNRMRLSTGALWICALGTAAFAPAFSYRLMMIRPHVLGMTLMMLTCALLFEGPSWKKILPGLFGLGWLFAWSYSTPHLILIPAAAFGAAWFARCGARAFLTVPAALGGLFCGLLIHPQSPNTFGLWKLQGVDALIAPISHADRTIVPFAKELMAAPFQWIFFSIPILLILYFALMMWIRFAEREKFREIPPETTMMLLMSGFWCAAMLFVSVRPVEYAVPTVFPTVCLMVEHAVRTKAFPVCGRLRTPLLILAGYTLLLSAGSIWYCVYSFREFTYPAPRLLTEKLRETVPAGSRVVNLDWSDFPKLTFLAPEYEYTWGLDPMFSLIPEPDRTRVLAKLFSPGRHRSETVAKTFGTKYAVLLDKRRDMGRYLQTFCGWRVIYDGPDGWIYLLSGDGVP